MATSLGMYLTNQAGRDHLKDNYPLRHWLLQDYFQTVKVQAEQAAGVPCPLNTSRPDSLP